MTSLIYEYKEGYRRTAQKIAESKDIARKPSKKVKTDRSVYALSIMSTAICNRDGFVRSSRDTHGACRGAHFFLCRFQGGIIDGRDLTLGCN